MKLHGGPAAKLPIALERVAREMGRAGRITWRGLGLRAQVPTHDANRPLRWCVAKPDVFSIRNTSVATAVDAIVHEIKVPPRRPPG
jgi:hypothetical protein